MEGVRERRGGGRDRERYIQRVGERMIEKGVIDRN
jgi:hypothetical protein